MALCILAVLCCGTSYWVVWHPIVETALFLIGISLASVGATGRAWATSYISGQKMKQLVTSGPYSICRNPLYFFSMILGVGFGFCTKTVAAPVVILITLGLLSYFQIRREEQRLLARFGEPYAIYISRIPRLLPTFRYYNEPDEVTVAPQPFKSGLFGIAFLLILIGIIDLLEALHQASLIPSLFIIY
jgi:protein-S-isoprenylcysteine O-methyltransferase Ste14